MSFDVSPLQVHAVPLDTDIRHVRLLRVQGCVDVANESILREALTAGDDGTFAHVVIDVSDVTLLSAAGVRALVHHAEVLAEQGRRLLLAGPSPVLIQILQVTQATQAMDIYSSVDAAITAGRAGAVPAPPDAGRLPGAVNGVAFTRDVRDETARLRHEVRDLRKQARSRPLIAQAQGMLQERYRLPDGEAAFALLRDASQRFNVKLRTIADAVVRTPGPEPRDPVWFAGRERTAPPPLGFLPGGSGGHSNTIKAALAEALTCTNSEMGDLQLTGPGGGLEMHHHHGFDQEFLDFFAQVDGEETACFQAASRRAYVRADIATDPVFPEASRQMLLAARSRTVHSIPMTGDDRRVLGVFSVHLPAPGQLLSQGQERWLVTIGSQVGSWLEWYERTVVRDALEGLHRSATGR
ncbi:STAS domain-containing protein [Streptomyces sp. NPDC047108]|uniref:STAS domain-containing protein n=1 Tax=Streptomyces sp. NPDC047108 TaxID=3155025 RepID=UPI0033DA3265